MEEKEFININKEEVLEKRRNIFIPICLGNKFFLENDELTENVSKYLTWALKNTKEKVLILIADKIQDTNYFVRNKNKTEIASVRKVLEEGQQIKNKILKLIDTSFRKDKQKIKVISYKDFEEGDPDCWNTTLLVYKEFKNNPKFRDEVLKTVKTSVLDRNFSEEQYLKLCDYVLDEFSVAYSGAVYSGIIYDLYVYPKTDSVVFFIESIQKVKSFRKLNNKLPKRQTGLVILGN